MPTLDDKIEQVLDSEPMKPVFNASMAVSEALHNAVLAGGTPARSVMDILHGSKWLGHPLHPVLTDMTLGGWALAACFDVAAEVLDSDALRQTADHVTLAATISSVPTAITGMADYTTFHEDAATPAALHGILNGGSILLYVWSIFDRKKGNRRRGLVSSFVALGLTTAAAWLGGELVYTRRIGVNHSDEFEADGWRQLMPVADLPQMKLTKADLDGKPILVYRAGDKVTAIGNTCSHAGGPLDEGTITSKGCIECPWHHSVFDLETGAIVHGPATQPQPAFEVRLRAGKVEIRQKPPGGS